MIITEQFGQTNSNMYSRVRWSCRQSNIPMSLIMAEREDGIYRDHGRRKNETAEREREEGEGAATSGVVVGPSLTLKECWWWLVQCVTRVFTCLGISHALTQYVRADIF